LGEQVRAGRGHVSAVEGRTGEGLTECASNARGVVFGALAPERWCVGEQTHR
jgi:hypothetical protein